MARLRDKVTVEHQSLISSSVFTFYMCFFNYWLILYVMYYVYVLPVLGLCVGLLLCCRFWRI